MQRRTTTYGCARQQCAPPDACSWTQGPPACTSCTCMIQSLTSACCPVYSLIYSCACVADPDIPLDHVLIKHRTLRKEASKTAYQMWFQDECPVMLPFTPYRGVSITGQGTFQGGTSEYRSFAKETKDKYEKAAAGEAEASLKDVKVCTVDLSPCTASALQCCCIKHKILLSVERCIDSNST
jgi:hypothetical protein